MSSNDVKILLYDKDKVKTVPWIRFQKWTLVNGKVWSVFHISCLISLVSWRVRLTSCSPLATFHWSSSYFSNDNLTFYRLNTVRNYQINL